MRATLLAAQGSNGWTAETWIALAGIMVAGVAVLASLFGVWLGAALTRAASEQQQVRQVVDLALVKTEIALDTVRIQNLQTALLTLGTKQLEAQLTTLQRWEALWPARDALTTVRVTHPANNVQQSATALDADLLWVYQYTLNWFGLRIAAMRGDAQTTEADVEKAFDQANQAQAAAETSWGNLRQAVESASTIRPSLPQIFRQRQPP